MTEQEFRALLALGHERPGVECKAPGSRRDSQLFAKVVRAALGMANRRDGGVVVIGVSDIGATLDPTGLGTDDIEAWNHDDIAAGFASYAEPGISFTREVLTVDGRSFVVLTIESFEEVPVLCTRQYQETGARDLVLRKGALYVRSRTKAETVEVRSHADMRDLIELATERRLRAFLRTARAAGVDLQPLAATADDGRFEAERQLPPAQFTMQLTQRGWWEVIVRPVEYQQPRVPSLAALEHLLETCRVELRGWDFPHIDRRSPPLRGLSWLEQTTDWEHYLEWWRLLQSGQFVFWGAENGDWRDRSTLWPADENWATGQALGAGDTLFFITEIFEFAARLAANLPGDDPIRIYVVAHGMRGRVLYDDGRRMLLPRHHQSDISDLPFVTTIPRVELTAAPRDHALTAAHWLFERFHWDAPLEVLRYWQSELRQ